MKKIVILTMVLLVLNMAINMMNLQLPAAQQLEQMETELDERVFVADEVVEVRIEISEENLQSILDSPLDEAYQEASVNYNGTVMGHIGVRAKGNSSLTSVARMDSDRYSLKLNFDYYVSGQTLSGLSIVNLNNSYSDATFIREVLTYELLAEMGVPTPKLSFVNLYVNDELWGLYLAVEEIDEPFLRRYFEDPTGDLYKPDGTGSDLIWTGDDIGNYTGLNLKTNLDNSNEAGLLAMLEELNTGTDYEKYIDVDGFLRYLAVSTAVVNLDSYQGTMKHNYYLYEEEGYFHFLGWDFNMSFGGFQGASGALKIDEPTQGDISERPLIDKLLAVPEYKEKYHEYLQEIVDGYLSEERFTERVNELVALISNYVEADPTKFYTFEEFQKGVYDETSGLLAFTANRVENIKQQLSGEISSVKDGTEESDMGPGGGPGGGFGGQEGERPQGNRGQAPALAQGEENAGQMPANGELAQAGEIPAGGEFPQGEELPANGAFPQNGEVPEGFEEQMQAGGGRGGQNQGGMMGGPPGQNEMGRGMFDQDRDSTQQTLTPIGTTTLRLIAGLVFSIAFVILFKPRYKHA